MQTHEYELQGHYGGAAGWELLTCEDTRDAALDAKRVYQQEAPQGRYRVVPVLTREYMTAWACRAADQVNGVTPARYPRLGGLGDFRAEFAPYWTGRTWASAYRHVLERLGEHAPPKEGL